MFIVTSPAPVRDRLVRDISWFLLSFAYLRALRVEFV